MAENAYRAILGFVVLVIPAPESQAGQCCRSKAGKIQGRTALRRQVRIQSLQLRELQGSRRLASEAQIQRKGRELLQLGPNFEELQVAWQGSSTPSHPPLPATTLSLPGALCICRSQPTLQSSVDFCGAVMTPYPSHLFFQAWPVGLHASTRYLRPGQGDQQVL